MKKLILFLVCILFMSCATNKPMLVRDPIFDKQGDYLLLSDQAKKTLISDPIFKQDFILYGSRGKEATIIKDPLFGNYLVFPEE